MAGDAGGGGLSVPPPAAARVADELLRRYGLGSPLTLEPVAGGVLNQNLVAVTARGGFFLKGYRYADPAPLAREHRLLAFVRGAGVPAVTPLPAPGGATFLRVGGRFWAVFPLVTDRQLPRGALTVRHAAHMGEMLGRIHAALARVPPAEAARFPAKLHWDTEAVSAEMREYEAAILRRPVREPFDQHALASFAYRRTLLAAGLPPPAAFATLPCQMLHGDYHEGNLFFREDGSVSAVIDWELAGIGPPVLEIVRALDVALDLPRDVDEGGRRLRAFLHAYIADAPLTVQECVAMPDLYYAYRVHSLWVYEEHYRKGSARSDHLAMQDLQLLEWWLHHRRQLANVLQDALRTAPRTRLRTAGEG